MAAEEDEKRKETIKDTRRFFWSRGNKRATYSRNAQLRINGKSVAANP